MRKFNILVLMALLASGCESHFISDRAYREEVRHTLSERLQADGGRLQSFYAADPASLTREEEEALAFLYAYMPLADLTDYPTDYYLQNVRAAFRTREELPWNVPELLFRHFVLPIRVNNENLDTSRTAFWRELKPRVTGLSMKDAILEVNHWCHEKVTYQPSDARTSSPLASVRTAYGRCGEESTFTVAALRSVGIPARQVYTPRWAHTDDNHAWVEAWADGRWWFLGACEPEPVLNLGWFNAPASRAMLMHTKVFGKYEGAEEVVLRSPNYTEVNLIDNYAKTARADLRVLDAEGRPVPGARVDFCIYNYAEFYPAVAKYTDADGQTFLTAGLGDMLAWASKEGRFGIGTVSFGKDSSVTIVLDHAAALPAGPETREITIVPPPEDVQLPEVSGEMRAENDRRLAQEDSIRHAYEATFVREGNPLIVKSRGNHAVISGFLAAHPDARAEELLKSLSDKDLRDVTDEILEDSYRAVESVLCPRVENEFLSPYKAYFREHVPAELAEAFRGPDGVEHIVNYINEEIRVDDTPLTWRIPMLPRGVLESRTADARSRDIFFVALARTFGIEARKDPVTGKIQYREAGVWKDVNFREASRTEAAPSGTLYLTFAPGGRLDSPGYYAHFTLSRITEEGRPRLLEFNEGQVDMGGGAGFEAFRKGVRLDAGKYLLVSGNRLADGSVPVTAALFDIEAGKSLTLPLKIRTVEDAVSVIGTFDSESKYIPVTPGEGGAAVSADGQRSILSQTGRGYFAVALLGVGGEPTNHVLRDIAAEREALEAWGRPILLLCRSEKEMSRLQAEIASGHFGALPGTVRFGIDPDGALLHQIVSGMKLKGALPVVFLADTFNRVVFVSEGYTIGLGARIAAVSARL